MATDYERSEATVNLCSTVGEETCSFDRIVTEGISGVGSGLVFSLVALRMVKFLSELDEASAKESSRIENNNLAQGKEFYDNEI